MCISDNSEQDTMQSNEQCLTPMLTQSQNATQVICDNEIGNGNTVLS